MKVTLFKAYQSMFVVYIHRASLLSHGRPFLPFKSNFRHLIPITSYSPFIPPSSPWQPMVYFLSL